MRAAQKTDSGQDENKDPPLRTKSWIALALCTYLYGVPHLYAGTGVLSSKELHSGGWVVPEINFAIAEDDHHHKQPNCEALFHSFISFPKPDRKRRLNAAIVMKSAVFRISNPAFGGSAPRERYSLDGDARFASHLETEDLIVKLADRSRLFVAQGFGGLLDGLDHGWRTTDEDLDILCRCWQVSLCEVSTLSRFGKAALNSIP